MTDAAGAHRDEGAHDDDASQRQAYRSELAPQRGCIVKKRRCAETPAPIFVSGHDRVAGGVWYGEVRVRHHGTDVPLNLPSVVEKPGFLTSGCRTIQGSSRRDS